MEKLIVVLVLMLFGLSSIIWFIFKEERNAVNILTKNNDKLLDDLNHQKYLNDQLFSRIESLQQHIIELQKSPNNPDRLEAYNLLDNILDQTDTKLMQGSYYLSEINPEFNALISEANTLLFTAYKLIEN